MTTLSNAPLQTNVAMPGSMMVPGMGAAMSFLVSAQSHCGTVRKHNEDTFVNRPELGLWAVADGAGGHQAGDVASGMLAEALRGVPDQLSPQEMLADLRSRVSSVHQSLRAEAARRGNGTIIASTVVILMIRSGHFACVWAGDSRAYLLRDGALEQITRDHSLVQELVDAGLVAAEAAESHPQSNVITRAVGADGDTLDLDKVTGEILSGDRFLLCSDGLSKTLDRATLHQRLASGTGEDAAALLVEAALNCQARDNVTAVVVEQL